MSCEDVWIDQRIEKTRSLIEAYEEALTALASGQMSYSLDTGQTRQTVTKQNITSMRDTLNALENRLATLLARRYGGGVRVTPAF